MLVLMTMIVRPPFGRAQTSEGIATYGSDCATPKTRFNLGDTVCAVATDSLLPSTADGTGPQRRFEWVTPDGSIFQIGAAITADPQNESITIPAHGASAQLGTWVVKTIDASNNGVAVARFTVQDPDLPAVDMWCPIFAPFSVTPGATAAFTVFLTNKGPNDAANVQLVVSVATNSTFSSETQNTGPAATCTNPAVGATGNSTCTIATLPANTTAQFTFIYQVDAGAPPGAAVTSTSTVSSDTAELNSVDNTFTASATIPDNSTVTCTVTCPSDIVAQKAAGQCAAVVNFSATGAGPDCGTVVCTPPSGSSFALGDTNVICVGDTGAPCVFRVTVEDPNPPSITCPADIVTDEISPGYGIAVVNFPPPTLNDGCQASLSDCSPPSGSAFVQGVTAVTCHTGTGSAVVSCSFTVTVNGTGTPGCTVTCPADQTVTATSSCTAVVTYAAPATSGTCGAVTCTPPSGATLPVGTTLVSCTVSGGPSCGFTVTVLAPAPPTITNCPTNKTLYVTADCQAAIPNLLTETVATGCSVTKSQSLAAGTMVDPGTYTVTVTAENSAGEAHCTVTVTVLQNFTGFFPPISNLPAINVVNAGRAIPVKFSLHGDKGLDIFAAGFPQSGVITCDPNAIPNDVEGTTTAGGSSLSYDPVSDQYTYVWATSSSWSGTCRQLVIQLKDGCVYRANFRFR
jgi:uncharacterized repeat protein (TIGR01451 family)